jgi:hypothetical protein
MNERKILYCSIWWVCKEVQATGGLVCCGIFTRFKLESLIGLIFGVARDVRILTPRFWTTEPEDVTQPFRHCEKDMVLFVKSSVRLP